MNDKERIIQLVADSTDLLPSVVRVCLEAAAPHMLAEAWGEGCATGNAHNGRWGRQPPQGRPVIPDEAVEAAAGHTVGMTKYIRIERDNSTESWNAVCPDCKAVVYMVTAEAVARGPRRESGSSALLPVTMSVRHECI